MDSEIGYLEFSLLYMERRFNIYSNSWRYRQLFEDIFKWMKDIFKYFNISSNISRYLPIIDDIFNYLNIF